MAKIRINGDTSGSVTLAAPATGSDINLTLPGVSDTLLRTGGGKVLQVVTNYLATQVSTNSTTGVDTGLSISITPQYATSSIFLIANCYGTLRWSYVGAYSQQGYMMITDTANSEWGSAQIGSGNIDAGSTGEKALNSSLTALGFTQPATTSPVTYKTRIRTGGSDQTMQAAYARLIAMEVSA